MTKIHSNNASLGVCIPTFQRPHLLRCLLQDLMRQSRQPDLLVVIDGDTASRKVRDMLHAFSTPCSWKVMYLPSNHANLPYQRYLGWRASEGCQSLIYLDDDIRISQSACIEKVLRPLSWADEPVVGVSPQVVFPRRDRKHVAETRGDNDTNRVATRSSWAKLLGSTRWVAAGGLSPSGNRRPPLYRGRDYEPVGWLRGAMMACRRSAVSTDCFSSTLFAMSHIGCGLGEDTFFSRRLARHGQLLNAFCTHVEHPDQDSSKAYPTRSWPLGHATSFSRRLLNDNFRFPRTPRLSDRVTLIWSYLGNTLLHSSLALSTRTRHHWEYASGYACGAVRGMVRKPTARRLTPHIDWWADAERALQRLVVLRASTEGTFAANRRETSTESGMVPRASW